ncbi:hypothetical protein ABEF93_003131 [Exophiala dermatitidis]
MDSMSGMAGMSGMGGMDMTSAGMFTPTNKHIAHVYWYIVAAIVGLLVLKRVVDRLRLLFACKSSRLRPESVPFRPENPVAQFYDTLVAVCRELAYPQLWTFSGTWSRYFTPPPLGRCLMLLLYWTVILTMLWSNTILGPNSPDYAYRWEIVGFRAGWVSVTQLPLIYLLAGKVNIISLLTGISYERLNWLHRWVARTIFLTVIVHWSYFFREWDLAHFVKLEMDMMPMVKYGFGAWAVMGWMILTGFGFFRSACYEVWLLQHLASAVVLLWLVYVHVPSYARYNVWFSIGIVVFDRLLRTLKTVSINLHLLPTRTARAQPTKRKRFGYEAEVRSLSSEFIHVRILDVDFSWQPGQHVYLTIPRAGLLEAHPFTIANVPKSISQEDGPSDMELYIRVHRGFTKRLHRKCRGLQSSQSFLAFISGPWGTPTSIRRFESLVLVATGNGAAFTVPIFQQALMTESHLRQICFVWIVPYSHQLDWFRQQLLTAASLAHGRNIKVAIRVYVTRPVPDGDLPLSENNPLLGCSYELKPRLDVSTTDTQDIENPDKEARFSNTSTSAENDGGDQENENEVSSSHLSTASAEQTPIMVNNGRPDLDPLIRPVVEEAWGETGIFACGGAQFTGQIRNYVASLSDERAVHKGTGAQGLYLFCETYGW